MPPALMIMVWGDPLLFEQGLVSSKSGVSKRVLSGGLRAFPQNFDPAGPGYFTPKNFKSETVCSSLYL